MTKINFGRLIIGGLIATVILFVTDGLFHEKLFHTYWEYVYQGLGTTAPTEGHTTDLLYFLAFELGRGYLAILLYVLMRPFYGPGPMTAIAAGFVAWLAFSVAGPAQFIPLKFYSRRLWMMVAAAQLVTSVVANIIAAWIYRDPATSATPVSE